jgi:hypothetical protein
MIKITFFLTRNGHTCSDFLYGLEAATIGSRSPNSILSDLGIGRSITPFSAKNGTHNLIFSIFSYIHLLVKINI